MSNAKGHSHRAGILVACESCLRTISTQAVENAGRIEEEMRAEGLPRNWVGQGFRITKVHEGHFQALATRLGMRIFKSDDGEIHVFCAHIPKPEGVPEGKSFVSHRVDPEMAGSDHHTFNPVISCGSCLMAAGRRYGPLAPLDQVPTVDEYAAGHPGDWPPSWFGRDFRVSGVHDSQAQDFIIGLGMKRARVKIFPDDPGTSRSLLFCSHVPITAPS